MIVKTFEFNKINLNTNKFFLLYGENSGFKEEIIKKIEKNFTNNIFRYDEKEILENEENFLKATAFVAITAPFVCCPSICLWALFGTSIKSIIKNTKIKKIVEYLLAILLMATAVIIVIN